MAVKDVLTLHKSQAETTSSNSADFPNLGAPFMRSVFYLNVSAFSGFSNVAITIQDKDPYSSNYFDVVTFTSVTGTTSERKALDPMLCIAHRVKWVVTGSGSITFSVVAVMATEESIS